MRTIQVNVPPDMHERLRMWAHSEGRNLDDYVLDVLSRDLSAPSTREWLDSLAQDEPVMGLSSEEITEAMRAA